MSNSFYTLIDTRDQRRERMQALEKAADASRHIGVNGDRIVVVTYLMYESHAMEPGGPQFPCQFCTMDGCILRGFLPAGVIVQQADYYTLDCVIHLHSKDNPRVKRPWTSIGIIAAKHAPFYNRPFESAY